MKQTEIDFLKRMWNHADSSPYKNKWRWWEDEPLPSKQYYYYLSKWTDKGWWEFGVTLRAGWFTPKGAESVSKIIEEMQ